MTPQGRRLALVKRKGGIALAVKDSFLKQFNTSNWVVTAKGRAAVLQLRGDLGALDVWCIYLHANDPKARMDTMRTIGKSMGPKERCLSILAGDWNFTTHAHDRYSKTHSTWTGDKQKSKMPMLY